MRQVETEWLSSDQVLFYSIEWLPDTEPQQAITLVHGLGEHANRYQKVAEYFTSHGCSVLAFDQRGHGKTGGKRGHIPSYATAVKDIHHFVEENHARHPAIPHFLYGHSLGGAEVISYCLYDGFGIQAAVATSPGLGPGTPVPGLKRGLAHFFSVLAPSFTMSNGLDLNNLSHDPEVIQAYKDDPLVHDHISAALGWDLMTKGRIMIQEASQCKVPLLATYGSKDHLVNTQAICEFASANPNQVTLHVFENLFHETHNEPEYLEVLDYIYSWFNLS